VLPVNQNKCVNPSYSYLKIVIACLAAASFSRVAVAQTNLFIGALKQNVVFEFSSFDDVIFTESTFTSLDAPETMVFDSSGNLFISNSKADSIKKITPFGVKTTFATDLDVDGMAVDAFGNLFVSRKSESSNASDGVILKFTPDGKNSVFASNVSHPKGLAFDSLGNLYLAYPDHNSILKFTPNGQRITFASGIGHPYRLAFDASGNLFVTDPTANSIFEISPSGVVSTLATNTSTTQHLNDLAFDSNGNLFVTFGSSVVEFLSDVGGLESVPITVAAVPGGAGGIAIEPPGTTNLSTRVSVQGGDGVAIAGFIISGSSPKQVLIRGLGASLSNFGIVNPLQDPTLDLYDSAGHTIATNDDWQTATNADQIPAAFQPADSREPAISATLPPGSFTAVLRGKNGGSGVGLIEMYDLSTGAGSKLTNVSTRGFVGTGENVMIGGFILSGGSGERQTLIRALGPTLAQAPFNITGNLTDPTLMLVDANGSVVASNNDWKSSQENEIQATGLAPPNDKEAAILTTLPPGSFTAIVSGKNGETGIALVDVFNTF
jgi:sugar lactone lactonase YvrE